MAQFETKRFRIQKPDAHKVLPIPAGDRWIFGHHPESWEVEEIDGVDRWVPVLRRFMVTPGCNGVRENGDSSKMEYRFSRDGWTFIENGGKAGEYAYECAARGGSVWLDVWVTPHEFAPGKVKRVMTDDKRAEYIGWRAALVDNGAIDEPDHFLLEHVMELFEDNHITRHIARMGDVAVATKVAIAQKRLDRMKGAVLHAPKKTARGGARG